MIARSTSQDAPRRMTFGQWAEMAEDEPGELVDGMLEEEEMPDWTHEECVTWFIVLMGTWLAGRDGHVGGSEPKFRVRETLGRKGDASVYLPGSRKPQRRGVISSPPDIVLEVISGSPRDARRDRIDKADDYAAFGVRWYWLLDPFARSLEIYALNERSRYERALGASSGRIIEVPGCVGLVLDLDALWARIDTLPDEDEASSE
jgi:Uma2 family endonuclease